MMADPQFTLTRHDRVTLWLAYATKLAADLLFLFGRHFAGKSWGCDLLGYWLDSAGCWLHELSYRRTARLVERWHFAYQWYREGAPISGATASAYAPVATDAGKMLEVRIDATDSSGLSVPVTSSPTAPIRG